ncbi:hypothetical protein [Glycocaulis sp.]|uniref:hypothetical protein n=1 Tax=Glycocaulis sp. TaxID=1969725 RepID=UPI0025BF4223|nr:hypothetical protein [Glycocaulis sp.]MCH8521258.1 hypothetical protein [Glycocaulis sp.]
MKPARFDDTTLDGPAEGEGVSAFAAELAALARRLAPSGQTGKAVMMLGITAKAGTSSVAAGLARAAAVETGGPVWLVDLDFHANPQASRARLNGAAYSTDLGTAPFWQAEPHGTGRLVLRKLEAAYVMVTRFQHKPDEMERLIFRRAPAYWQQLRAMSPLAVVDVPHGSPAISAIAPDLDGVILVANARRDKRADAERLAAHIEKLGARVLGVIVNRAGDWQGQRQQEGAQ